MKLGILLVVVLVVAAAIISSTMGGARKDSVAAGRKTTTSSSVDDLAEARRTAGIPGVTGEDLARRFEKLGLTCEPPTATVVGTRFDCNDPSSPPESVNVFVSVNDSGRVWAGGGNILGLLDLVDVGAEARHWFPAMASAFASGGPDEAAVVDWMKSAVGQDGSIVLGGAYWRMTSRENTAFFSVEASDLPGHGPAEPLHSATRRPEAPSTTVSSEDETIVPDVVRLTATDARRLLGSVGLSSAVVEEPSSTSPQGTVIGTDPAAGETVGVGATVTIYVSTGPATERVPQVIGLSAERAIVDLDAAGFVVQRKMRETTDPEKDGIVIDQSPGGGSEAKQGSTVTLVVGRFAGASTSSTTNSEGTDTTAP